jgi:hypothetical protein
LVRAPGPCEANAIVTAEQIEQPLRGSFTRRGADETVEDLSCGSSRGTALLRREGQGWAIERFAESLDTRRLREKCTTLRLAEGRDLAICIFRVASYGDEFLSVAALDYSRPEEEERIDLITLKDDADTACTGKTEIVVARIDAIEVVDLDGDTRDDLVVTAAATKARVSRQPPCERPGAVQNGQRPLGLPHPRARRIEFLAKEGALVPTAPSAAILKSLKALSPEQ